MKERSEQIKELALKLYCDLPFYQKWRMRFYYRNNNWDVTGKWDECLHQAERMVDEANSYLYGKYKSK